jgi:tape measure domain-containing protein
MAAPELRLDVRLNLATFRTDLGRAAQAAAAYYYPINLLINKQNLTKQLTAIGRSLGTTKYNIDLNDTSVDLAAGKIDKLAASLKKLSGSIQIDFNAGGGTKPLGTAMREMAAKLAKETKGDINRAVEQMTGMRGASPFGAGTRSIPGFKAAAKGMGIENAFKLFFQELQQVDPQGLKKALDDGSVMMMQENREIKQKFDKIQSSAEGLARDLRAMGETAKATGKASLTADGKTLYPQNYGLKIASLLSEVEKLDKDLRRVSTESGGELLNTLTELSSVLRTTSNSFVGIAGFSKNLDETLRGFDVATKAATKATTAYADRINRRGGGPAEATAGPRLLSGRDPGGALVAPLRDDPYRVIQAQVKNAFDIIEDYHKRQLNNFTSGYKKIIEDYHRKILIQLASVTEYRPSQKLLGGTPPRLALPPIGGATTPERQVRISTGAYLGQPGFMRAPFVPPSVGGGGGRIGGTGGGPGDFARRGGGPGGAFNIPKLPGAGLVREIGTEFGFAAKQVLLFGTAYKALAFIQGFPAQVGSAVGALQSFRNTLGAISPSAEEAAASSQFILDIVDKYNTPIQSARDGFTKLYASMKPTGFSGDEIRDLFLGISQAAATFGMSAEKVDRVNYAFAQMASKGQVMSEELKGQLGDVLPGAMGIFAEAAGFEGPDAITKFSKALEDGAYKGAAMKTLLTSVGAIMRKEFGPGAEGAARTFQGVINRMQNSLKLLYESFEPVAVGFLNSVVMPMTSGIKTLTDGFNAFFTGQAARTAGGSALVQQLNELKPSFEGILQNLKELIPTFQLFGNILLGIGKAFVTLAGNPIAGFLLKVYANVLLVNGAFTLLGGKILIGLIGSINTAIARFIALNLSVATLQRTSAVASSTLAGTQVQMALLARGAGAAIGPVSILRGALFGIARLGAIVVSISVAIYGLEALIEARRQIDAIRGLKSRGGTAATLVGAPREKILSSQKTARETIARAQKELAQVKTLRAGMPSGGSLLGTRQAALEQRILDAQGVLGMKVPGAKPTTTTSSVSTTGGIPAEAEAKGGGKAKGQTRESQIPQLTLALEKTKELSGIEMLIVNAQLMSNTAQLSSLELLKQLVEFKYEAKALGLEDLTTEERALKYKEIGLRREQAIAENQLKLQISLKKERDEIQQGFSATLAGYQQEANYQQMYLDLINQGVLPSLAKVRVEAEKAFAEGEKQLNQSIEQQEANIAGLEVTIEALKLEKNLTPEKQKQLEADEKRLEILKEDLRLRGLLKGTAPERKAAAVDAAEGGLAPKTAREYMGEGLEAAEERLRELTNTGYQVVQAANAIGDAFGAAFKGLVSGSMTAREALAGMFQSIADHFADMVAQMIAEYLKMALIKGIMSIIGGAVGGGFTPLSNEQATSFNFNPGAMTGGTPWTFANGGIAPGGFTAFANGGMVTGPTMGLVGEGRYNEAIVPLPDGKSIPVQLAGGDGGNQIVSNITVNVSNGQAQSNATGSNSSEMGRKIEGAVRQVIVGELRPGGLLASKK